MTKQPLIDAAWRRAALGLLAAVAFALATARCGGEPVASPTVTWTDNLGGALARAGNELKPILLVFTSPDCPWCARLKSETLAEKEVLVALEGFICVAIDASRNPDTAQEFQVRGVPAMAILSGDGRIHLLAAGFMDKAAFLAFLDEYRQGGGRRDATPQNVDQWLKALQAGNVAPAQWPEIMAGLGIKGGRTRLHNALLAYEPSPRREWVALLRHPRLAVRLGAFELLEELAGETYSYDPWLAAEGHQEALARWQEWAAGSTGATQRIFAPLREEQIVAYIRDLISGDRDRSARAVRMLEQSGESVIPMLEAWSVSASAADIDAQRRVKEVRYFLLLPDALGTERARIAHRLVFGNQDERAHNLAAAAAAGSRALPVLADFLADADPLIREAAVDSLIAADKNGAYPFLCDLLKNEKDEEVVHAVVRAAGRLKGAKAVELVGPYLTHPNEDLVVAALASLGRTKSTVTAANAVKSCLHSPRWRVRAAALEALGTLRASSAEAEVVARLDDADPFVRRTAVLTLASLSAKKTAQRLAEVFLKDDQLKGPIVAALRQIEAPIPATFGPALKGKDPEVLLSVLEGLGDGGDDSWRLALPFVPHENGDVACVAIRIAARGGGRHAEVQTALAKVLRDGEKERVRAVFESYPPAEEERYSAMAIDSTESLELDQLVAVPQAAPGSAAASGTPGALANVFSAFEAAAVGVADSNAVSGTAAGGPPAPGGSMNAVAEQPTLQDIFSAFGSAAAGANGTTPTAAPPARGDSGVGAADSREGAAIVKEALKYLDQKHDLELRFSAAAMLLAMGQGTGVTCLVEALDGRTAEERLTIARRAGQCRNESTLPLVKRLLRDSSAAVRQAAVVVCLKNSKSEALARELIGAAFEPESVLPPVDLFNEWYQWFQVLRRASVARMIKASVHQVLGGDAAKRYADAQRILALTLLEAGWRAGDGVVVARYLDNENPFIPHFAFEQSDCVSALRSLGRIALGTSSINRGAVISRSMSLFCYAPTVAHGATALQLNNLRSRALMRCSQ